MTTTIDEKDFRAQFRQEQREREEFLRNTHTTTTVTEQIDQAIIGAGGNTRDALNNVLAGQDMAVALLRKESEKTIALMVALEEIRAIMWQCARTNLALLAIDKIACEALRASGEIA